MNKRMNYIGMCIVIGFFFIFYIFASFFLNRYNINENKVDADNNVNYENTGTLDEVDIISNLYKDVRILYDVVNNKFKVMQDDVIIIRDITYKKITNFSEVMDNLFTLNGQKKYINDLGSYFAYTEDGYYLAGNLVTYQTYYFRGDNTNIYVTSSNDNVINGIIYEKWTSNNKNTLATIRVVNENGKWLVDDITILSTE